MYKVNFKKEKKKKGKLIALVSFLVIILCITIYLIKTKDTTKPDSKTTINNSADQNESSQSVNLDPPSKEEQNPARDNPITSKPSQGSKIQVTPIITSFDKQEVRAWVSGINEDGGSCIATYTKDQDKISTPQSSGISDVSHTSCQAMTLKSPINIPGSWEITVTYNSSNATGTSQPVKLEVK